MKKTLLLVTFVFLTTSTFAQLMSRNITITQSGWSDEYVQRIKKQSSALKDELLNCYYTKYLSYAKLNVTYENGKANTYLTIPYSQNLFPFNNQNLAAIQLGDNGFSTKVIEEIMTILYKFQVNFATHGMYMDNNILDAPLSLFIMKDDNNWGCFQGYLHKRLYDYPTLSLNPYFKICHEGKQYYYTSTNYDCINNYGYIFGGALIDRMSGKTNQTAEIFAAFFLCGNKYATQRTKILEEEELDREAARQTLKILEEQRLKEQKALEEQRRKEARIREENEELALYPNKVYQYSELEHKPKLISTHIEDSIFGNNPEMKKYIGSYDCYIKLVIDTTGMVESATLTNYNNFKNQIRLNISKTDSLKSYLENQLTKYIKFDGPATRSFPEHKLRHKVKWQTSVYLNISNSNANRGGLYTLVLNKKSNQYKLKEKEFYDIYPELSSSIDVVQVQKEFLEYINSVYKEPKEKKLDMNINIYITTLHYFQIDNTNYSIKYKPFGYTFNYIPRIKY